LHQNGVEPIKCVSAACEACDTRRHPDERSWRRWCCLRLTLGGGDDAALAFIGVLDANQCLIDIIGEQPAQRHVFTAQHDDVTILSGLYPLRLEARELFAGIRRP
jgi:hypothetical protein